MTRPFLTAVLVACLPPVVASLRLGFTRWTSSPGTALPANNALNFGVLGKVDRGASRTALVEQYMSKNVVTVAADMSLNEASCILSQHGITGAPVVRAAVEPHQNVEVIGMLSQTDLLYRAAGTARVPLITSGASTTRYQRNTERMRKCVADNVFSAMSEKIIKIKPSATIAEAAEKLLRYKVSRLPVLNARGDLVGIISTTDVMEVVTKDPEGCGLLHGD
jgi:CBS domain-containing protein